MTAAGPAPVIDAARTAAELRAKLASLAAELTAWKDATAAAGGPLWRHHTQIQALAGTFGEASAEVARQLADAETGLAVLERASAIDSQIMDLHRLWDFFRSKFALRYVPWLAAPLMAADDLAWACYSPAQRFIAADRRREPPLVYFTGGTSPFLLPRGTPYLVDSLPDGSLREAEFAEAVRLIPVAVIGLPWFGVDHLPDAPLIGHEAGHAVDQDLGLAARVRTLIKGAVPESRREAWAAWSREVFADIYGALCCGSGFAQAMAAVLAADPQDVAGETRAPGYWGSYPTRTLRVLLVSAVLAKFAEPGSPQPVAENWLQTYEQRPFQDYEPDAARVADAVIDGPYDELNGAGLTAVMPYTSADERTAARIANRMLGGLAIDTGGVRHIMAAARLAYDQDRTWYARRDVTKAARVKIASLPSSGVRRKGGLRREDVPRGRDQAEDGHRDQAAGRALAQLLGHAAGVETQRDAEARGNPGVG